MNEREANTYEQLFERIRSEIEHAEKEINETKIELEKAKKIRRNKMEYDALAKVILFSTCNRHMDLNFSIHRIVTFYKRTPFLLQQINLYPSRADTGKKKQGILSQLNHLKEEEEMLEDKLQTRKKQFHVLVQSIHRLQELIDQEEEATDAMIASVHSVNMSKEEGLLESEDDASTGKDELNTSNVSSSPEDAHMDVS